uniref:NADH dehydrogenase subunit 6 n=1 Tax=Amblyomma tigrinum TaxID=251399 RepID=UPI002E78BFEB|nr:NADH dehydrogenase subunit 6 [Amblyomma tigrinum]WQF69028.1 NADH dehydrogenase subunit 6 [Amblyomma tigrinum]
MKLTMTVIIIFMSMSHPMMMLISIIMLTFFVSFFFYNNFCNSFIPLIMILLILGGMLIIFMYMVSLCPNKKMNFNYTNWTIMSIMILIFITLGKILLKFHLQDLIKIYFPLFMNMLLLMMCYLLITLTVVMKILNWISSPLKSF